MRKCERFRSCFEVNSDLCETHCRDYGTDERKKAVVRGRHNRKITFNNPRERSLTCYKIDENHVIKEQRENENVCDNLLLVLTGRKHAIFVELKGGDINHAVEQIRQTSNFLKSDLSDFTLHGRIVNTRVPAATDLREFNKLKLKFIENNGTFEMRRDGFDLEYIEKL